MNRDSKASMALLQSHEKGYRVTKEGFMLNPKGERIKGSINNSGYISTNVKLSKKIAHLIFHQLQAYQKFGDEVFDKDYRIHVRHKDGDKLNNSRDNILIGTQSDNMMDRTKEDRLRCSKIANTFIRKISDEQVIEIRRLRDEEGMIYLEIGERFNITKGHTCDICNRKLYKDII